MLTFLLLLIVCTALSGCSSKSPDNNYIADYDKVVQVSTDIDFGDVTYNIETDSQNYFPYDYRNYTATPDGYYLFYDNRICFIDKESLRCLPVCAKPECGHKSMDCDAYMEDIATSIFYYNDNLYTVMYEVSGSDDIYLSLKTYSLYRISLDGSVRSKIFEIYSSYEDSMSCPMFIIHRGYIYYNYGDKEYVYLVRRNLDGSNPKIIYRDDISTKIIGKLNGYGDGVVFAVSDIMDADDSKILYYSSKSEEVFEMTTAVSGMLAVTDDSIICNDGDNIYKVSTRDLSKEVLIENNGGFLLMSYDGRYLYVDNVLNFAYTDEKGESDYKEHRIFIYSTEGELVDTIDLSGNHNITDFGDEKYLFFSYYDVNRIRTFVLDKTQIGTGNYEWKEIIFD